MGISTRTFLLDRDDRLFRVAVTQFDKMLASPARHCYPQFAGQRVPPLAASMTMPAAMQFVLL